MGGGGKAIDRQALWQLDVCGGDPTDQLALGMPEMRLALADKYSPSRLC